ncbi:hypothetical protein [Actinokineospora sp. HUAS TT18]|uniref:hypothetical protein n=1 Tax=Actinokineospora sp. HUAS TT18 TaxID=3447451 RepID=UPI003F51BB26
MKGTDQSRSSAKIGLWRALAVAVAGTALAVSINFATAGGSSLWWVAVAVSTLLVAVAPVIRAEHLTGRRVVALVTVIVAAWLVTAGVVNSRPTTADRATPTTTTAAPRMAAPLDSSSEATAARLSDGLRASGTLPASLTVKNGNAEGVHEPPLEFEIRQGAYRMTATLHDARGSATLVIDVDRLDNHPARPECGAAERCYAVDQPDGTRVQLYHSDDGFQTTAVTAIRSDGTYLLLDLCGCDPAHEKVTRDGLPLSDRQLVDIATAKALSIT